MCARQSPVQNCGWHRPASMRGGMSLLELLVVIGICALLIGLVVPAIQRVRAASDCLQCKNRLRSLGLACAAYHDAAGHIPCGCSFSGKSEPQPHMSWLARALPWLEEQPMWSQICEAFQAQSFFETPPHYPYLGRVISHFLCPSDDLSAQQWPIGAFTVAFTDFVGVEGTDLDAVNGVLYLNSRVRWSDVTDGLSNTLLAGERPPSADRNLGWWYAGWGQLQTGSAEMVLGVREIVIDPKYRNCDRGPYSFRVGNARDVCDAFHFWSFHPGGANFVFCDGSVRFLSYGADPVMPALATRSGGESLTLPD